MNTTFSNNENIDKKELQRIEQLEQEIFQLREIIDNFPGDVYWKNKKGIWLGVNKRGHQSLQKMGFLSDFADVVGKTDSEIFGEKTSKIYRGNDNIVIEQNREISVEEETTLPSGKKVVKYSTKKPLHNQQQEINGIIGISIDITEKKHLEKLEKEKEIAQKHSELMNILSSSIAHEIRTPLSIIKINADLIDLSEITDHIPKCPEKSQFLNCIANIHQAIKECTQVMDMLLVKLRKLATQDTHSNELDRCSISETIQTALFEYPFRENEKKWIHYIENNEDFSYFGHTRLTKHILFNLLRNALHVIQEAQKGEIFIDCQKGEKFNYLIFRDTALGIDSSYLPKIFNKFETTDDTHSGTGLGLAFCKLVMESYGGEITCRSELDQFTEFTLSFPAI